MRKLFFFFLSLKGFLISYFERRIFPTFVNHSHANSAQVNQKISQSFFFLVKLAGEYRQECSINYHLISSKPIYYHLISSHVISCHLTSSHLTSPHLISYHISSHLPSRYRRCLHFFAFSFKKVSTKK